MTILSTFELTGTFFFAISGALAVKDKDHDWFLVPALRALSRPLAVVRCAMCYWAAIRWLG
jgi:hypothetical protein